MMTMIIRYSIVSYSQKLSAEFVDEAVRTGLKIWSDTVKSTTLEFIQVKENPDISIEFSSNDTRFLKHPWVAAYTKFSKITINDRMFFSLDGRQQYTITNNLGKPHTVDTNNLPVLIAHEFGHVMGLTHTKDESDLMCHPNMGTTNPSDKDISRMEELLTCKR